MVQGDELEKRGIGKRLPSRRLQGLERGGEHLGLVAEGEADPELAPVHAEDPAVVGIMPESKK